MRTYRKMQVLTLCVALSTFAYAETAPLNALEKEASELETQLDKLEEKIASFEEAKAKEELNDEAPLHIEEMAVASSEKLPLSGEEKPFVLTQETKEASAYEERSAFHVDLKQAFSGSPIIYSILAFMSTFSFALWFYSMVKIKKRMMAKKELLDEVRNKLIVNQYEEAYKLLADQPSVISKMLLALIDMRKLGHSVMLESMRAEGKRATISFWQKLGLLSDVAIMAPMLGLLGTVLGMFYAFYDINRSIESITTLFDGLGISVGTTVAGLIVALFAMLFHSLAKFRLVRELATVENEAQSFVPLINNKNE